VNLSSGPPVMQNTPGVFDQTGGRMIPIRARIGLRSGKLVQRSTYRARIGGGVIMKKGVLGGGEREALYGVEWGGWPGLFFVRVAGEFFRENF
jgi:hypothetical protein